MPPNVAKDTLYMCPPRVCVVGAVISRAATCCMEITLLNSAASALPRIPRCKKSAFFLRKDVEPACPDPLPMVDRSPDVVSTVFLYQLFVRRFFMASLTPGLAAGTADNLANTYASDLAKTATDNAKVQTNLQKAGRDQAGTITGG